MGLTLFILFLLGSSLFVTAGVLLWRRFYRDDPQNTARRVVKNSAVPLGLRLLVRALDLVFAVVLLGTLDAAVIGPYTLAALLVAQYLSTFTEFGLGTWLTREVARETAVAPRLFGVTLSLRWLLVLLGAAPITLLVIAVYEGLAALGLGEPLSPAGQQAMWVLLLTLVPSAYSGAATALYNAQERMEVPALIELVTAMLSFVARLGVLLLGYGILGLAWAAVGVSSITALIYYVLQRRDFFAPSLVWNVPEMRALIPTAFPLMLNNMLSVVFFRFDLFILRAFGGEEADLLVQQYAMPYQIVSIALILPPVITFAVFPLLSRRALGDRITMVEAQNRTLQVMLWLAFPLAMGLTVLSEPLVQLFTRDNFYQYGPSVIALSILAWFLPLSFVNGLLQYVLIALDRQRAITYAFIIGAVFNLALNLLAIPLVTFVFQQPLWSIYAAAAITILSEVVLLLVFTPLLHQEMLPPPLLRLSWRPLLAALLMGLAMQAAAMLPWRWWGYGLALVLAPPIYLAALWILGTFGVEERALARRILGRAR
jgi:O-antigen/teichoic acid export membrane protein